MTRLADLPFSADFFPSHRLFFSFFILALVPGIPGALHAQTVSFAGPGSSVNFGNANLCAPGKTIPAPCSVTLTLNYKVTGSGTLGATKVVTGGVPDLEFTQAGGSTCAGSVTAGTTCTVNVTFAPRYPGGRPGAVQITDESGQGLVTTPIYGFGVGPQLGFNYGSVIPLPYNNFQTPSAVATDAANDVFVSGYRVVDKNAQPYLLKFPANGGQPIDTPLETDLYIIQLDAVDGAGNIFFTDPGYPGGTQELPSGGGSLITLLSGGFSASVDGAGDLFVADDNAPGYGSGPTVELPFGCQSSTCAKTLTALSNYAQPLYSVSADIAGDLFYDAVVQQTVPPYGETVSLYELPAGTNAPIVYSNTFYGTTIDGLGNLYTEISELPAGGSVPDGFNIALLSDFTVDAAGDVFFIGVDTTAGSVFELQRSVPPPLNFGAIAFGGPTPTQYLTVTNTGTGTLTVSPSISSPNFKIASVSPPNCLAAITPAEDCYVLVEFNPLTAGTHDDILTLQTNALKNASVSLTGTAGPVEPPFFMTPSGVYPYGTSVTITDATPDATIYYTTNGSMPTAASTPYTGPIYVASTARVTAFAIVSGIPSTTVSAVYDIAPYSGQNYQTITDFNGAQYGGFQFNGSAAVAGSRLQLTDAANEAGSVFLNFAALPIQTFTNDFAFELLPAPGSDLLSMADGITFTIQNAGDTALGVDGSGLGYAGIGKSVALKFDMYDDGQEPSSVGLYIDGASPTTSSVSLAGTGIDLHSGDLMFAQMVYDGANLVLTLTDTVNQATWSHSFAVDIHSVVGRGGIAILGFTGSTGAKAANQRIFDWTFIPELPGPSAPPLAVPALPTYRAGMIATGMTNNGAAEPFQTTLRLASGGIGEAGSAFYSQPVNVAAFTTDFTFELAPSATSGFTYMGDGMTFTIQNEGVNARGLAGEGLGYTNIARSVAIKFDLHNNAGEGNDSTGLYVDGAAPTIPAIDLTTTGINLHSGDPFQAHLTYDGANLTMTLTDTVTSARWTHSFAIDIPGAVGGNTAFVGFTGATGEETTIPEILNWTFTNP